jgi:hypothetical protein
MTYEEADTESLVSSRQYTPVKEKTSPRAAKVRIARARSVLRVGVAG